MKINETTFQLPASYKLRARMKMLILFSFQPTSRLSLYSRNVTIRLGRSEYSNVVNTRIYSIILEMIIA